MKRLLLEPLIWLALGSTLAFGLNLFDIHPLDTHPGTNWFMVGLGFLIIGAFRCMPSEGNHGFGSLYASNDRERLRQTQEEEHRLARAMPGGFLMMVSGALLVAYAALFA
jgi:hypothetical protein